MGRTSIQVSERLRRKLERRKAYARQSYEDVIESALVAARGAADGARDSTPAFPEPVGGALLVLKRALREAYGDRIMRLVLFGSYARGEARPGSDVDVLLVLDGEVDRARELERIVDITYDILLERGVQLSVIPMAAGDFLTRATPLLINVRREGVPL